MQNPHNKFAVAGRVFLLGTLNPSIVGCKYIWYAMHHDTKITGEVRSDKRKPSSLANGGLEIIINSKVDWEDMEKLAILTKLVEQVNNPLYIAIIVTIQKNTYGSWTR